eukprot:273288_1
MLREFCNQQTDMDMQAAHVPLVHCYSGVISIIRMDGMVMSFKYNEMNELYCYTNKKESKPMYGGLKLVCISMRSRIKSMCKDESHHETNQSDAQNNMKICPCLVPSQ